MITPESPVSQQLQGIAEATGNIVTPANAVDAVAFGMALHAAPRLDTWSGIAEAAIAYGADFVDGKIARATGTASEVGSKVDAVGDKIKLGWGILHIARNNQADRDLLAAVAVQNVANAAITAYDRKRNEEPAITEARPLGKRAMFGQAMSIGVQVIGTKVSETHPRAGRTIRQLGRWTGLTTVATLGIASTIDYAKLARSGTKKPAARSAVPSVSPSIYTNVTGGRRR